MSRRRAPWLLPAAVVALAATVFVVASTRGSTADDVPDDRPPVDLVADGPRFATVEAMAAASDLVVEGVVSAVDEGRTITDPARPDAGIVTRLVRLDVVAPETAAPSGVTVEQEATLLDGTPVTVNGVPALTVGDHGVAFLVRGAGDEFPFAALVNEQAWIPVVDGALAPIGPDDPIVDHVTGATPSDLVAVSP